MVKSSLMLPALATVALVSAVAAVSGPLTPTAHESSAGSAARASSRLLTQDMSRPSETLPHGVPTSIDWAVHPRVGHRASAQGFTAFTPWGQLYGCVTPSAATPPPVELRDLQTWTLSGGHWKLRQRSSALRGGAYRETYAGNVAGPPDVLRSDTRATVVQLTKGFNYHFWPGGSRLPVAAQEADAVAVAVRARFSPSARVGASSCAVLSVGGDYWRSPTAPFAGPGKNNVDAGIGRFKRIDRRWRLFTMTTASAGTLRRHPLPLSVGASELR